MDHAQTCWAFWCRCAQILTNCAQNLKRYKADTKVENIGAKWVRQAATKTNDLDGDGTTKFVVLAQGLIAEGVKVICCH